MGIVKDAVCYAMIGGVQYPHRVEAVMSGEMQARYAYSLTGTKLHRKKGQIVFHPDYVPFSYRDTENAILGAFALRMIGKNGVSFESLQDLADANEKIPNLETIDGDPVTHRMFEIGAGCNLLRVTKVVSINDGLILPRERGIQMLEEHPQQPYAVYPGTIQTEDGVDIGGAQLNRYFFGIDPYEVAQKVHTQYVKYFGTAIRGV